MMLSRNRKVLHHAIGTGDWHHPKQVKPPSLATSRDPGDGGPERRSAIPPATRSASCMLATVGIDINRGPIGDGRMRSKRGPRGTSTARWAVRAAALLPGALLLTGLEAQASALVGSRQQPAASSVSAGLAARLVARDPGARFGGTTVVATGTGGTILAVPHRPNFIMALGSHETIVADGRADDQVGALGADDTLRAGGGNDELYGGVNGKLIGGSGRDLLVDTKADATVTVHGSRNEVIVSGTNDRVICAPGLHGDLIYHDASDAISTTCRKDGARILADRRLHSPPLAQLAAATSVTGDGTAADPFQAPCDSGAGSVCTVSAFPLRRLIGLWANESVPSYRCPDDHEYLLNHDYVPAFGTTIVKGVEIQEDEGPPWPINVSITATVGRDVLSAPPLGTATGFLNSGATNWTFGSHWYRVILHCTSDLDLAAPAGGF